MANFILKWILKKIGQQVSPVSEPPFIIIGMHRSGTSIVTRVLRKSGGYFGYQIDPNSEPIIFLKLNHNFLANAGTSWDVIPEYFNNNSLSQSIKMALCFLSNRHLLWSEFFQFFNRTDSEEYALAYNEYRLPLLDFKHLINLQKHTLKENTVPFWGWKDPRTTFTLPFWLKLFPNAKVIHVIRNGIDVSLSLWRRSKKSGEGAPHCQDLIYCFDLWQKYVKEGIRWRCLPKDRYIEIRYEELLNDPISCLNKLFSFSDIPKSKALSLSKMINNDRMKNRPSNELLELMKYASQSHTFCHLEYDKYLNIA